jgi:hypothetical protein
MAHPTTVTVPDTVDPALGTSMAALGGVAATLTVMLAEPMSGVVSVSVADTVMVCDPGLSVAVFN